MCVNKVNVKIQCVKAFSVRPLLSSPGGTQGPGGLLLRITKLLSEQVRQDEELCTDSQVKHEEWQATRKK